MTNAGTTKHLRRSGFGALAKADGESMTHAECPEAERRAFLSGSSFDIRPPAIGARPRIEIRQDDVRNGLGKLVLTVVELVRELLERQAIRRMDAGSLTDAEIERLGATFLQLSEQMTQLKAHFGLKDEDLNIDLGPLGKLL